MDPAARDPKLPRIFLHPGREKRILRGHRWIFSNEISTNPLSQFEPGSWVEVSSGKGFPLGSGYINPRSLIAVRIVCPPGSHFSRGFLEGKIRQAKDRREGFYFPGSSCYRAVYGESDDLPGLVVDRYGDVLVYQVNTVGMSKIEPMIQEVLLEIFRPRALVYRNDSAVRSLEGLPLEKGIAHGEIPVDCRVSIDGLSYALDPLNGQKTGFYLDQRENRRAFQRWVADRRVLDLFCYNGSWGLMAVAGGAREATGVDQSRDAIEQARANASENGMEDRCRFIREEAFHFLKSMDKTEYDCIVVDPPSFAKTRSSLPTGKKGYVDLNRKALLALPPGGILVSCSCSYHVDQALFQEILLQAGRASGRRLRLLEARAQAADHPILLAMPETHYLKCCVLEVL